MNEGLPPSESEKGSNIIAAENTTTRADQTPGSNLTEEQVKALKEKAAEASE